MIERIRVFAPAKVNLTLHVTGQRDDGYHLLDSLVAFADVGDVVSVEPSHQTSLTIDGAEAAHLPPTPDNLIYRTAQVANTGSVRFTLTKTLPVSSGIGGGSADAAAAFRGLQALKRGETLMPADFDPNVLPDAAGLLQLGADIPMCLMCQAARIGGIGDKVAPLGDALHLHAVLVNPRRAVATPSVFKALKQRVNPPMSNPLPDFSDTSAVVDWLAAQRNDLQQPAIEIEPQIGHVLAALEAMPSCALARMSGSGASCFGVFDTYDAAADAAADLTGRHPDWWVVPTLLGSQTARAMPQIS